MAESQSYRMGETIANRYVIERKLGESQSAELFLVTDQDSKKSCAKVYFQHLRSQFFNASDFLLKSASASSFQHANSSHIYEINEEMGLIYLIREYSEGQNWESWVRGRITLADLPSPGRDAHTGIAFKYSPGKCSHRRALGKSLRSRSSSLQRYGFFGTPTPA